MFFLHSLSITMKTSTILAVACLCFVAGTKALDQASMKHIIPEFLVPGQCPSVDEKALWEAQEPNLGKFSGRWYEYARTSNPYQIVKRCTHSNLTFNGNGFNHKTMGLNEAGGFIHRDTVTVPFTTGPNAGNPHLSIMWENPDAHDVWGQAPFVILDTDYESYACIYSCVDYNKNFISDFGFMWSRDPEMSTDNYLQCKTVFNKYGVNMERFQTVQHGNECNYALMNNRVLSIMSQAAPAAKVEL